MKVDLRINSKVFNKAYLNDLNNQTRTQLFYGGSSSGKSYFLAQRTVLDVLKGGRNYLICRNVQVTIKKSVFNEVCKAISFFKADKLFSINKSDSVITCVNGYQILFSGLDDAEKIKSVTPAKGVLTDIWAEEATECEYKTVKQLYKRLRGFSKVKKRMILSFNPILKDHWIYQEYFKNWDESKNVYQDDLLYIRKTTYKDNQFLTQDDIDGLENESDPYYYQVYSCGNWGVLGAVIFKNWEVRDLTEERKHFDKIRAGLDFGYSADPAACVVVHYDKKRETIYIFEELYACELTNDLLANEVKRIAGNAIVTCDGAEPKSIAELKKFGVRAIAAKKGKDSVNYGIQWLQRQKIVIDVKCQNTKNEFQKYKWREDKNGNVLPVPVDKDNHAIDALRYCMEDEMKAVGKLKIV